MKMRIATLAFLTAILLVASANAHMTVETDAFPEGPLVVGETYSVSMTGYVHCAVMGPSEDATAEYHDGQVLTLSIVESVDFGWLTAEEINETLALDRCEPVTEGGAQFNGQPLYGTQIVMPHDITFTVGPTAPAFETVPLQPGAFGETNEGGNFSVEIAYNPEFTVPTALAFNVDDGHFPAAIPLTMAANADSNFSFEVVSFTVDGAQATDGASGHIADSVGLETGIATEEGIATTNAVFHFTAPGGEEDHEMAEGHRDEDMGDGDGCGDIGSHVMPSGELMCNDGTTPGHSDAAAHAHWGTAQAVVSVTLAAAQDATLVSEAQQVVLTFTNTDSDTQPHVHGDDDGDADTSGDDEGLFTPGPTPVLLVAAIGAMAILRRRL